MPAFGSNPITIAFAQRILNEPNRGFRLNDRIVSALDRFIGALSRFIVPSEPGIMTRWLFIYPFVGATDWTHALNLADAPNSGFQGGGGSGSPSTTPPTGHFDRFKITWSGPVTHNANGVTMNPGTSANTNVDCADLTNYTWAWNRKTHGFYSRTNSSSPTPDILAQFVEPRNGYSYWQAIYARHPDGNAYGDLCYYSKSGTPTTPNRCQTPTPDSLGLFTDNQRGATYSPYHYLYKRGIYSANENSQESGMGFGDPNSGAFLTLNPTGRNYAFLFSTRYIRTLEGPLNTDGSGGQLPGSNADFNSAVQQLQTALLRNV